MLTFRGPGAWGAGIGADLDADQVDENFWTLFELIAALSDGHANQGIGIANITSSLGQVTFYLTDGSTRGPFTIPSAPLVGRGAWAPSTTYSVGDIVSHGSAAYLVVFDHTSQTTFSAGANDGVGDDYYQLLIDLSAGAGIPTGGQAKYALVKSALTDFAVQWVPLTLGGGYFFDVIVTSAVAGQVLTYDGFIWGPADPTGGGGGGSFVGTPAEGDLLVYRSGALTYNTPKQAQIDQTDIFSLAPSLGSSGTQTLDLHTSALWEISPTADLTINASNYSDTAGLIVTLAVITSGATSYDLTFDSASILAEGVLSTGTVSGKILTITFRNDGAGLFEIARIPSTGAAGPTGATGPSGGPTGPTGATGATGPVGMVTPRTVSGTTTTLVSGDDGNSLYCTNSSGCTVMVPTGLRAGFTCGVVQGVGAGTPRASLAGGLTAISYPPGLTSCAGVGAEMIVQFQTSTVVLIGGNAIP